jgi:hypothetical protein
MVDITAMGREPDVAWRHGWYSRHFLTREIFGNELPRASAKVSLLPPVSFSLRRTITFPPVDPTTLLR